jgi:hypothetical protein
MAQHVSGVCSLARKQAQPALLDVCACTRVVLAMLDPHPFECVTVLTPLSILSLSFWSQPPQVAANTRGIQLVGDLISEHGLAKVQAYMAHIQVGCGVGRGLAWLGRTSMYICVCSDDWDWEWALEVRVLACPSGSR